MHGESSIDETEALLHASEERFHHLVDAVTDYAIFMLDESGHVTTWNAGAMKTKGYTEKEILGKSFEIFYTPEDRAAKKPQKILERVRREGRYEEEGYRVRKDGSRFWASVIITALRAPNGEVTGFAKVTRDLTERRAAEENERALSREQASRALAEQERRRLLTLLEEAPATINFFRGADLVFELAHPRTITALGGLDPMGKPLHAVCNRALYVERVRQVFETGRAISDVETLVKVDVEGRSVETFWDSMFLPVRDSAGRMEGVMTFELDVTTRVHARAALERINRSKDEFLATISHELRTPLNAISGWATLLGRDPSDPDQVKHGLDVISRNVKAQLRIVDDLLDVSRIINGKLQLAMEPTEIAPVIHAAVEVVRPASEGKGVRLVVDVDPEIGATIADADRLQQVIWNLLTNAIRYTPRGGRITVTAERTGAAIEIRVSDTGIGIAADNLPFVFERFRQLDSSTTRKYGGLGLGLAIVKHLVEAHGGMVTVESPGMDHGTTFIVRLPIHDVAANAEAITSRPRTKDAAKLSGLRILAVDDEIDSLELLRFVLEAAGATVVTARTVDDALERVDHCDVVITDIGMPEADGYAFMRKLRERPSAPPAIALTAYARPEDVARAKHAGFREHLAKPIDHGELLDIVSACARAHM
jgi:PAS domain S-box-containing protein